MTGSVLSTTTAMAARPSLVMVMRSLRIPSSVRSKLVSVITVIELTKRMTIAAVDMRGWLATWLTLLRYWTIVVLPWSNASTLLADDRATAFLTAFNSITAAEAQYKKEQASMAAIQAGTWDRKWVDEALKARGCEMPK